MRREWAESRAQKSTERLNAARAVPLPPFGEPIKIGHHSERRHRKAIETVDNRMRQAVEHEHMAKLHERKADGIEAQLESSIYSDDDNAVEALEARIAEREAEREGIKAYNASCRKGKPDPSLLTKSQREHWLRASHIATGQPFPGYVLSNLSGRIKADRDRLESIKRQNERKAAAEAAGGISVVVHPAHNWAVVTFADKPERAVLDELKAAGFRWGRGSWQGYADKLPARLAPKQDA